MNVETIAKNLHQTIGGKERYLNHLKAQLNTERTPDMAQRMAIQAVAQTLEINVNELKAILKDVELCYTTDTENTKD
jgi:hypothetical protein